VRGRLVLAFAPADIHVDPRPGSQPRGVLA
jgi:hypothetical protein